MDSERRQFVERIDDLRGIESDCVREVAGLQAGAAQASALGRKSDGIG
jgi:hypothetical protein